MSQRITPNQLLAWSVINQETARQDRTVNRPLEPIDPKWIEIILGKPDSARILESIGCIMSDTDLEKRLLAFDELELLIESMDNALDLQSLKQWPNLLGMLEDPCEDIKLNTCWVMGTAVQNNAKCQQDFARHSGISILVDFLKHETSEKVLLKAIYCLSSAIRQNKSNFDIFMNLDGLDVLKFVCSTGVGAIIKRILFLLSSLVRDEMLLDDGTVAESTSEIVAQKLLSIGLLDMILEIIQQTELEEEYVEFMIAVLTSSPNLLESDFAYRLSTSISTLSTSDPESSQSLLELKRILKRS